MNHTFPGASRRLLAFAFDWLVVALWGSLVFGSVLILTGGPPPRPAGPWSGQAVGFVTMTVPVTLYFVLFESSRWRASPGKRAVGLAVSTGSGASPSVFRSCLRNAIKFVPWECGHTLAQQAAFAGGGEFSPWLYGPVAVAVAGPVWWLTALVVTGQTPYDRWTDTRVTRTARVGRT